MTITQMSMQRATHAQARIFGKEYPDAMLEPSGPDSKLIEAEYGPLSSFLREAAVSGVYFRWEFPQSNQEVATAAAARAFYHEARWPEGLMNPDEKYSMNSTEAGMLALFVAEMIADEGL